METRQLQVLAEVARTGTYTAAAEALGYTQPAVSYQMRMLEQSVGAPLVSKAGRSIRLTPVGIALARHAETVLAALRTAEEEVSALAATGQCRVRMAAFQSACVTLVPSALDLLRRSHPELEVVVGQAESKASHEQLLRGDVDLAVMCDLDQDAPDPYDVLPDARLRRFPLLTDRRCVLLPADHPAAAAPTVALADLADERWVLETGRGRFVPACQKAGFTPRVAATSDDQLTIHSLVARRVGLGVMHELGATALSDPRVVARPLRGWPRRRIFASLWPAMAGIPAVTALLQALQEAARRYGAEGGGVQVPDGCGTPSPIAASTASAASTAHATD